MADFLNKALKNLEPKSRIAQVFSCLRMDKLTAFGLIIGQIVKLNDTHRIELVRWKILVFGHAF